MKHMTRTVTATALLLALLSACGGDGDAGTSSEKEPHGGKSGGSAGGRFSSDKVVALKDDARALLPDEDTNAPASWDSGSEGSRVSATRGADTKCRHWGAVQACADVRFAGDVNFGERAFYLLAFGSQSAAHDAFGALVAQQEAGGERVMTTAPAVGSESQLFADPDEPNSTAAVVRAGTVVVFIDYWRKAKDPDIAEVAAWQAEIIRQHLEGKPLTATLR